MVELLLPIVSLAINVMFQILCYRFLSNIGMLKSVVLGFVGGLLSLIALEGMLHLSIAEFNIDVVGLLATNILTYLALGYCYFHFINLGETARRIRILRELHESKNGLTLKEIIERYSAKDMVDVRFGRLLRTGQIRLDGEMYKLGKPLVLYMARTLEFLKLLFLGKKSEFE